MKKIILILIAIFSIFIIKAQTTIDTALVLANINNADKIFEGQVIEQCCYKDSVTGEIFTNNIVYITKIAKGDLFCGTVSVITAGGTYQDSTETVSHNTNFNVGCAGLFLCNPSEFPHSHNCERTDYITELQLVRRYTGFIGYQNDAFNDIVRAYRLSFDNIMNFYDILQIEAGISMTVCDSSFNPLGWTYNNKQAKRKPKTRSIPVITSINGSSANTYITTAGTKSQIIIKGMNFGATEGNLFLRNADDGGSSFLNLNKYDITSWSDTEIVCIVPGAIDSAILNTSIPGYQDVPVGTGVIGIENTGGGINDTSSTSTVSKLKILFALDNSKNKTGTIPYYKDNRFLFAQPMPTSTPPHFVDSTYHFKLNSNVTDANMIICIKTAFRRWSCMTGVNFILDAGTTNAGVAADNEYTIVLQPIDGVLGTSAQCRALHANCHTSTTGAPFGVGDIDISIDSSDLSYFWYDTTDYNPVPPNKIDFFNIILHEIGHAHLLKHVNDTSDVMYYLTALYADTLPAIYRHNHFNLNNQHAGDYIVQHSIDLSPYNFNGGCLVLDPMKIHPMDCRLEPLAINQFDHQDIEASIFPNPFSNSINIQLPNGDTKLKFQLISLEGNIIHEEVIIKSKTIFLPKISKGIYFAKLFNNKSVLIKKMVCID